MRDLNITTVDSTIEANDKISIFVSVTVDFKDKNKAMDAGWRVIEYFVHALKDQVCRAKFEATHPSGFRLLTIEDLMDLTELAKEGEEANEKE